MVNELPDSNSQSIHYSDTKHIQALLEEKNTIIQIMTKHCVIVLLYNCVHFIGFGLPAFLTNVPNASTIFAYGAYSIQALLIFQMFRFGDVIYNICCCFCHFTCLSFVESIAVSGHISENTNVTVPNRMSPYMTSTNDHDDTTVTMPDIDISSMCTISDFQRHSQNNTSQHPAPQHAQGNKPCTLKKIVEINSTTSMTSLEK